MIPVGIELVEELVAASRFVRLADGRRLLPESVEGAQESAVGLVAPADVAGAAPTVLAEQVEAPVVTNPIGGIRLHPVAGVRAELGPGVEKVRPTFDDRRDLGAPLLGRCRERRRKCGARRRIDRGQDGVGRTRRGE